MDSEKKDEKDTKKNGHPIHFSEIEEFVGGLEENDGIQFLGEVSETRNALSQVTQDKEKKSKKKSFNLPENYYNLLTELSEKLQITKTEVVRQALKITKIFADHQKEPHTNCVELVYKHKDGTEEKITIIF